jgi:hypothetical protein
MTVRSHYGSTRPCGRLLQVDDAVDDALVQGNTSPVDSDRFRMGSSRGASALPSHETKPTESEDPVLEALWTRVIEAWDDERPHAALLEHAIRAQRLPVIAARYRRLADDRDGDGKKAGIAKKQLDAIVERATDALLSIRMPRPPKGGATPLPITLSAFGVCLFLLAWLAYAIWGRHS